MQTAPVGPEVAREEARWLRLGDVALANHYPASDGTYESLSPGMRALEHLKQATKQVRRILAKYQRRRGK